MELKDTLNLPKTQFPMRGNLVKREPERLQDWEAKNLYQKIQDKNADKPAFILHDGPPFTNGDIHIGHALNKILKDAILRYKSMGGFRTPYTPGWDCHGLPIEHKVSKDIRASGKELSTPELRDACAAFSEKYIDIQRAQFKRLGILADWDSEYKTKNPGYEADILRTFSAFVEKGLVYRSKKPVYWSIPCRTALAEAEIEYQAHVSPSIWVKFALPAGAIPEVSKPISVVIWTTTPWTLPANLAVAVHPRLQYVVVEHGEQGYLVAKDLAKTFIKDCELEGATLGAEVLGETLENVQAQHPFIDRPAPIVLAEYVTTESGTGCVHTAPGHGLDDYLTGLKYGLDIYCPLNDDGCYIDDDSVPAELIGVSVLEKKGKCPANQAVLTLLKEKEALLQVKRYDHQYPFCWRSKTPVIFRAMDQWFVSLDKDGLRESVIEKISAVNMIPSWGANRIRGAVESRPDWCISRQRSWGVPIPVFYDEDGNPLLDASIIQKIADKVETAGTQLWFTEESDSILEGIELPAEWQGKTLIKGKDTLDVWIDSGCSHRAVLQKQEQLSSPADLYLEGSDQHRGWFQSSLWTGVIADGDAPFKNILTHGFIVDEKGEKLSKSKGSMSSDGWVKQFGADIVRLWISSQDFRNDVRLSKDNFKLVSNTYRTIRNTLCYQLGNLRDFDFETQATPPGQLDPIDQWALGKTAELVEQITAAYDAYEFHKAYQLFSNFFKVVLSNTYHDILKDRLYTYAQNDPKRRSSQTAIKIMFDTLIRLLAPVLTFTTDEAYCYSQANADFTEDSIHLQDWPTIDSTYFQKETVAELDNILKFRDSVNEKLEVLRQEKTIGTNLEAQVTLNISPDEPTSKDLQKHKNQLPEIFIVSQVTINSTAAAPAAQIEVSHATGERCPRCWRWLDSLVAHSESGQQICSRCHDALESNASL